MSGLLQHGIGAFREEGSGPWEPSRLTRTKHTSMSSSGSAGGAGTALWCVVSGGFLDMVVCRSARRRAMAT